MSFRTSNNSYNNSEHYDVLAWAQLLSRTIFLFFDTMSVRYSYVYRTSKTKYTKAANLWTTRQFYSSQSVSGETYYLQAVHTYIECAADSMLSLSFHGSLRACRQTRLQLVKVQFILICTDLRLFFESLEIINLFVVQRHTPCSKSGEFAITMHPNSNPANF
jgi:hypothetical protein